MHHGAIDVPDCPVAALLSAGVQVLSVAEKQHPEGCWQTAHHNSPTMGQSVCMLGSEVLGTGTHLRSYG
jgi:hypothetical protein